MTFSSVDQATAVSLKALASSYLKAGVDNRTLAIPKGSPNKYGSLSEVYNNVQVFDGQDYIHIDPSKLSTNGNLEGIESDRAAALAVAFKNATAVDPSTGIREISQSGVKSLANALYIYAITTGTLTASNPFYGTSTGSLTLDDIQKAVTKSISSAVAGGLQSGLSISLAGTTTEVVANNINQNSTDNSGFNAESIATTLNLSISSNGELTSIVDRHAVQDSFGTATIEGTAEAPAQNSTTPILQQHGVQSFAPSSNSYRLPVGEEAVESISANFVDGGVNTFVAPETGAKTTSNISVSGKYSTTYKVDHTGVSIVDSTTTNEKVALSALIAFSHFQENQKNSAISENFFGTDSPTLQSNYSIVAQLPSQVKSVDGTSSVLYVRPNGSFGKFLAPTVNDIA